MTTALQRLNTEVKKQKVVLIWTYNYPFLFKYLLWPRPFKQSLSSILPVFLQDDNDQNDDTNEGDNENDQDNDENDEEGDNNDDDDDSSWEDIEVVEEVGGGESP